MIIKMQGLTEEEKEQLYTLADENPDCAVREIEGSFDGLAMTELLIKELIPAIATIIAAIIAARKDSGRPQIVIQVQVDGKDLTAEKLKEIEKLANEHKYIK